MGIGPRPKIQDSLYSVGWHRHASFILVAFGIALPLGEGDPLRQGFNTVENQPLRAYARSFLRGAESDVSPDLACG